eukprot:TRINITY_DN2115_c0_g3_i2.p1 TRINITY_DN2115_c0_g3~~TRINITY_DN2115_c0_g3_i2.p1  ORF type:complete len:602 (+),score=207.72 TRINITY_DN2115_c0_g3_i2:190-1995(+)
MNWVACVTLSLLAGAICFGSLYSNAPKSGQPYQYIAKQIQKSGFVSLILINFAFNLLFVLWKAIQYLVFGKLRENESKNVYDRLLQYVILKVLFVAAVNIEPLYNNTKLWVAWFTIIGFMKSFTLLSRDRLEYITTFNPTTSKVVHAKILVLLFSILVTDTWACYFCFKTFKEDVGIPTLMLLTFEYVALFLDTVQTLVKYMIHFIDLSREKTWESRGSFIYYTEFVTDTLILVLTLGHYIQIFFYHGIQFTLIDAILFFHMRMVFQNLRTKIQAYRNYRQLALAMRDKYLDVPSEELEQLDDVCPVCHDRMQAAKKLPCGHIFHHSCLRSWLENHHNCPTCRFSLLDEVPSAQAQDQARRGNGREELFRFNGPRWLSWLPSIQIVSERVQQIQVVPNEMIRRVQEILPHAPADIIARDLLMTRSVEATIENFLEGRVQIPVVPEAPVVNNNVNNDNNPPPSSSVQQNESSQRNFERELKNHIDNQSSPISLEPAKFSDDFASTSTQRQQSLAERKKAMLELARSQFLEKQRRNMEKENKSIEQESSTSPSVESETRQEEQQSITELVPEQPEPTLRRRLALEAAERRQREQQRQLEENMT